MQEQRSSISTLGTYYALVILLVVSIFNQIDRTLLSILQLPLKRELMLSDTQLGALTGLSFSIVYCTFAVPISRLADRYSRKWLMSIALAVWSVLTALSGFASGFAMLVVCRMGVAIGESSCSPATLSMISDYFPIAKRARAIAIWSMSVPIGIMFGVGAGGWMSAALGWRNAFIYTGAVGLLLLPPLLVLKESERGQADNFLASAQLPGIKDAFLRIWRTPALRYMVFGGGLSSYVLVGIQVWSAPFFARVHHMGVAETGLLLAGLFGVGGGLGAITGGALGGRLARKDSRAYGWLPAAAFVCLIPVALVEFLAPSRDVSIGAGFFAVVLFNIYLAPLNAGLQSLMPPNMRAFIAAILLVFTNLCGLGLGVFLTGVLSDYLARSGAGEFSIRYALCSTMVVAAVTAVAYAKAGNGFPQALRELTACGESTADRL